MTFFLKQQMPTSKGEVLISSTQTPRKCYFENDRHAISCKGMYTLSMIKPREQQTVSLKVV